METKVHTYDSETPDGEQVQVTWDQKRCIHVQACVEGLPGVFDPDRRPWIDPAEADADAIEDVVMRCPTGALHLTRGGADPETPPARTTASVFPGGPLLVRGDVTLKAGEGDVLLRDTRMALCRCGLSHNKPLCDGSHDGAFDDDGTLKAQRLSGDSAEDGQAEGGAVTITAATDGPLLVDGPLTVEGAGGDACAGTKGALCRCGASESKPFCDGSHAEAGFEAS
jgi:CDGSH-type Zn-finger protein/uncharacterized Fe-S cluster protein YjdI